MDRSSFSLLFFFFSITITILLFTVNSQQNTDSCSSNLNLNNLPFDSSSLNCTPVWAPHNFILRYKQSSQSVWTFILSAPSSNAYIGMGFSSNGQMVGSSAIVGWISSGQAGTIKRYYLGGQTSSLVQPDQGSLNVTYSMVLSQSQRIYLIFQINSDVQPSSRLIYSLGPDGNLPVSPGFALSEHSDKATTFLNYTAGQISISISTDK